MGTHADAAFGPLQDEAIYQWIAMDKPASLAWLRERWTRVESRISTDGTEAVRAAADHLLLQGITRLIATVTVGNHASDQVLEKAGFSFSRVIPNSDTLRGVPVNHTEFVRSA